MAKGPPDLLRLRDLKYSPRVSDSERIEAARGLLEAGRCHEALDLFLIAGDEEGIERMRKLAVERGRPTLLLALLRARREVGRDEWKQVGDRAVAEERWRDAFRAYTRAGDSQGLERVRAEIPDYELWSPQGK